ncbi:MAG: radical SAM family RiPP maturation amino acid epimerase [Candidatus Eremiobacteraeota bacterium]|nr:radical SAM family RiPP maturation amino acid epimerase [Candidatus Eremiobacteraeota bacterium]MCW5867063.1 radical SAM family RiPP maturation amino acid epimerase [Candidatus Eremiobacteraeota bacterium]
MLIQDFEIHPIFRTLSTSVSGDYLRELALVKRFCEIYRGDDTFRAGWHSHPEAALDSAGLALPHEQLWPLVDSQAPGPLAPAVSRYLAFQQEKLAWREQLRSQMRLTSPGLDAWRGRQIQRCAWQLAAGNAEAIFHPPAAFELARGCSVGCWFCGVSAPKLADLWPASPENRRLWKETLEVVFEFCGPAAAHSFLYWATDPLDNPDYEQFCLDFHAVFGQFPQTTTALAGRDPERTRKLLRLSQAHGCLLNRFSLSSKRQLRQVHEKFSPEELLRVELILQNKESLGALSAAGKALSRIDPSRAHATTIACVSGFLFNMCEGRVRWVTPYPSGPQYPDGYKVEAEAHFESAAQLREVLAGWCALPARLPSGAVPRWREDLTATLEADAFRVHDSQRGVRFDRSWHPQAPELAALIGEKSVGELALQLAAPAAETVLALQRLYQAGLFA